MATFHIGRKLDLITTMVVDSSFAHMMEGCLFAFYGFQHESIHISKYLSYDKSNKVKHSMYWTLFFGHDGLS
jgi:hypothetical protein